MSRPSSRRVHNETAGVPTFERGGAVSSSEQIIPDETSMLADMDQQTPIIDPTNVDHAPISVALPRVHLAGSDADYDAHIEVGRHGFSIFLTPTAEYPTLDIDGTREQLERVVHELTDALSAFTEGARHSQL